MNTLNDYCELIVDCEHKTAPIQEIGYPSIRTPNIGRGFFNLNGVNRVSETTYAEWTKRAIPVGGDLILAREAPVGNVAVIPEGGKFCLGQRTVLLRPNKARVVPDYLCYLLLMPSMQALLIGKSGGATVRHLNMRDIRSLPIGDLPALPEQEKTASVIKAYDDLIATNQSRIALLEESARMLYREWFVNLRFPGFEQVKRFEGVPEGWSRERLDAVLLLQRGFDLPNGVRKPGNTPIYASAGINGYHSDAKVKGPGIVTGRSGTLGLVHYVPCDFWPLNTALWVKEFLRVTPLFAYFMLLEMNLAQYNSGASVPSLDRKVVHPVEILLPPGKFIELFGQYVKPLFEQTEYLREANLRASEAREALLPKLMSGAIQV